MHSDLSLHLHTEECKKLILAYFECHRQNPWMKFLGGCNSQDMALRKCIRKERLDRTHRNLEKNPWYRKQKTEKQETSSNISNTD